MAKATIVYEFETIRKRIKGFKSHFKDFNGIDVVYGESALKRFGKKNKALNSLLLPSKWDYEIGEELLIDEDLSLVFNICTSSYYPELTQGYPGVIVACKREESVFPLKLFFRLLNYTSFKYVLDKDGERQKDVQVVSKTERYHDVYDTINNCVTDTEVWELIRGKVLKVVDLVEFETVVYDSGFVTKEFSLPVFSFAGDNAKQRIDDIEKQRLIEYKYWGPKHDNYRIVRNDSGKWGIRDENTMELILNYVFDQIEWLEDIDCVKFTLEGKVALWPIKKISDLNY